MMNDELVWALRHCTDETVEMCPPCPYFAWDKQKDNEGCMGEMMRDAADAIEKLISRLPKWISVNEKLPDSQRPVLVYVPESEGFCEYVGMADYTWSPKGGFWCGTDGETYGAIGFIRTPTHWCELPEPPKGE